jgi:3',5'-cyclic AMP phosphodiesterase CpdA
MKVIAHISDLHFGAEDAAIAGGLLRDLQQLAPALIVASGDFTQRARRKQFAAARAYLDRLAYPRISVPGNHDVPFYDVFRRFLAPLVRYRTFICPDVDPWFEDEEVAILGINTARSLTWKSGRISEQQIELIRTQFAKASRACFKIIVTHHPFIPPPGDTDAGIDLVGRAALALPVIDECCVDLLLAGHLHRGYTGDVRAYYPATNRSIIVAQAGTAISHRTREQPNGYNVLFLEGDRMCIAVRSWNGSDFSETTRVSYDLVDQEWKHRT